MIALLNGNIASVTLNGDVTIDVNGVGYKVSMPERETINLRAGNAITVFVHTQVREDSIVLFGFIESSSKELFEKLISVSGIGGKLALVMLSVLSAQGIVDALSTSDVDMLCSVPGIGKKTAQKIILNEPNCKGDNPTNPFLIKIKELPQINARTVKNNHFNVFVCIAFF